MKDQCVDYWLEQQKILGSDNGAGFPLDQGTAATDVYNSLLAQYPDAINPLLNHDGFDPHKDSPVEPLHTMLLGTVKYCWTTTCEKLTSSNKVKTFQARLNLIAVEGMNIPKIRASYVVQYREALIGRQFKALMQVTPFTLYGLVDVSG